MKSANSRLVVLCVLLVGLLLASPVFAQQPPTVTVSQAKMSIPFGEVNGYLVQVGEYLVFINQDQRQNSFAVNRADVRNLNAQDDTVNLDLNRPISGPNGQTLERLAFRLEDRNNVAGLTAWGSSTGRGQQASNQSNNTGLTQTGTTNNNESGKIVGTYPVKHKHMIGDCRGNLIIKDNGISYESINNIDDSRQWAFRDIRELHRDNPYKLTVDPFAGDHYDFEFLGKGMDNNVFQTLVQRVTSARVAE